MAHEHGVVSDARTELYALNPELFLPRRAELVAATRATDPLAAKQIGAFRKPTRAAYVVNQLVRAEPDAPDRIAELAGQLQRAQANLDGAAIRELSERRHRLVAELTASALGAAGVRGGPIGLRDEVAGTLNAALADPDVLDRVREGSLVRPERWDGLGVDVGPTLSLVPPTPLRPAPRTTSRRVTPESAEPSPGQRIERRVEQRRADRLAELMEKVTESRASLRAAERAVAQRQDAVRDAERRLADARRELDDAMLEGRVAQRRVDAAQVAFERAAGKPD